MNGGENGNGGNSGKGETVKKYEGLFIFNLAGREEGLKEALDRVTAEITAAGGRIETIQKMDKKSFARVADRRHNAGHYVNVIFEAKGGTLAALAAKFQLGGDVFRVLFTEAGAVRPAPAAVAA